MEYPLLNPRGMTVPICPSRRTSRGFTLVEMLVVMGIIAIMSAAALPNIMGYVRSMKLRAAQDSIAGALQKARARAITSNTQFGVSFIVQSVRTPNNPELTVFWVHNEDPRPPAPGQPLEVGRQGFTAAAADPSVSTRYELDPDITIATANNVCTGVTAANQESLRFDRYGTRSFPGVPIPPDPGPPALAGGGPSVDGIGMTTSSGEAGICLLDLRTGLTRAVLIAASGRIRKGL